MKKAWIAGLLGAVLLWGCAPEASQTATESTAQPATQVGTVTATTASTEPAATEPQPDPVAALLGQMTLREKVGQLFIIRPDSLDISQTPEQVHDAHAAGVTAFTEEMGAVLREYPAGGMVIFGKNIEDPRQITAFLDAMQGASDIPLWMAVDEEGGLVARLANHPAFNLPQYESAAAVGKNGDPSAALSMGNTIGTYLHSYGFCMDFAPVADVNTNPRNPIIGNRAFSADPVIAAQMAQAMARGLKQQGIVPVFKHFPGHGDTREDSHSGIAISYKTKEEMAQCEWRPYTQLTPMDCVMVGHIATPNITGDMTPATLSPVMIRDILRQELGFSGLVITDSLAMGAITEEYTSGQAAVNAFLAGCDILLMPQDYREAFDAVVKAVEDGMITESQLDATVTRILQLKLAYGL